MRVNRFKRDPVMSPGRWIVLGIVIAALLLVSFNMYYRYVQSPVWKEQKAAESDAKQRGGLKEIDDSYAYTWDEPIWVVSGRDENGADTYVWLKKDSSITIKASDGLTKDAVKAKLLQAKPDADIAHIRLGLFGGEPVWEIFYSRKQAGRTNHFYDFYRFRDGSLIVMYKLPSQ
ncbi:DUF5590 domain-containing protein [Paenibacillus sacheonensis]|uniref:Cell wall elongation regulator TseB-like domain-containing protein n=1 Tax=Paenibacillus sacheonensis TaxID=742054 RepID=A0A7X5BY38_9BACL|nr:DUF5590 domain-containing protein [Paenibacillus sacheonensis]MBM7564532.1 uncharacterized protein YpmB [Paenibacillus sacheonensis]NBC69091.1 hypothetical protein [Paenibacillus sacheonensis]